jgi:hypothetical protein
MLYFKGYITINLFRRYRSEKINNINYTTNKSNNAITSEYIPVDSATA